jgi:hypothetical protein
MPSVSPEKERERARERERKRERETRDNLAKWETEVEIENYPTLKRSLLL